MDSFTRIFGLLFICYINWVFPELSVIVTLRVNSERCIALSKHTRGATELYSKPVGSEKCDYITEWLFLIYEGR